MQMANLVDNIDEKAAKLAAVVQVIDSAAFKAGAICQCKGLKSQQILHMWEIMVLI